MSSGRKWIKRGIWTIAFLIVAGVITAGVLNHMVHGTPDWYQPDVSTPDEKRTAADRVENLLMEIRFRFSPPTQAALAARRAQEMAKANSQSAAQSDLVKSEQPDLPFDLELTDAQLNAYFQRWETVDRQHLLDEYVEDPRIVIRDNQLILVGKVKSMGIILSFIFEPRLDDHGDFFLNLVRVQGGMLAVPDAMWSGKRDSIEQMLARKLPPFQARAAVAADGTVNGDTGSAAINEMLLAVLRNTTSPAVIFVPVGNFSLAPSFPVRITAMSMRGHSLKMTARKMTPDELAKLLKTIKTADPQSRRDTPDPPDKPQ